MAYNDDWCGLCSNLAWTVDVAGCESFILEPGCYDGSHDCGGIISVTVTAPPSDDFYSDDFYATDDNFYNFYNYYYYNNYYYNNYYYSYYYYSYYYHYNNYYYYNSYYYHYNNYYHYSDEFYSDDFNYPACAE